MVRINLLQNQVQCPRRMARRKNVYNYLLKPAVPERISMLLLLFVEKPSYFGCSGGKMGLLSSMFTSKEYRRQGIAKELLTRVMNKAKEYGCGTVQITTSDMGVLLYTDFGFVSNGNFMQYKLES